MADNFAFVSPGDGAPLRRDGDTLVDDRDGTIYPCVDGIWRLLPPDRADYYAGFMADYQTVRQGEGRGSDDPAWFRALPFTDLSGQHADIWRMRAQSYRALMRHVIWPLTTRVRRDSLTILDLGAGNGWLSNRLTEQGHHLAAVDLMTDPYDGLGAAVHYETEFTRLQAAFDHLPLESGQFDLAVFNGSLHYAADLATTLSEALRVLKPDGLLAILDSPTFRDPAAGEAMVAEREAAHAAQFATPSDAIPTVGYLTYDGLDALGAQLGVDWQFFTPFYGLKYALQPIRARWRDQREPARFHVIIGTQN